MMDQHLHAYLSTFRRRMRWRDAWNLLQHLFPYAAGGVLIMEIIGRILPIEHLQLWALLPLVVWLVGCGVYALFRPRSLSYTARHADLELGLRQRLSTALAFEDPSLPVDPETRPLLERQRQDALRTAAAIQPAQAFPLTWRTRRALIATGLLVAAVVSAYLPNRMDAILAEREAVRQEAARQADKLEQQAAKIEQSKELSPEERDALARQLRDLAEQLRRNPGSLEQAMADLSNLEKALQARLDQRLAAQAANLESLAAALAQMANTPRNPQDSATDAAAEALAALAEQMPQMTPEQRQQTAEALAQQAAQAQQSGDAQLAQALSALASAMQAGDAAQAAQAAQSAQGALSDAQQRQADQQALQQALSQLQSGRQQMAQAAQAAQGQMAQSGQPGQGQPGQGQQPGQGNQPGQGQGSQPGNNPGQGSAQGTMGGGSNANTLPPASGGSTHVRPPQGSAAQNPASALANQVYAPWLAMNAGQDKVFLPGQDTGQGQTTTSEGQSNLPGQNNPALIPYSQVFGQYSSAAYQAMQSSYIPPALQLFVQSYFNQLAPR